MNKPLKKHTINADQEKQGRVSKILQETECRHLQIIQNLAAAIYTCDARGYIQSYNKAAVELWGREPEIGIDLWCGSWMIFELDGITPMSFDTCPMAIALKEGHSVRGRETIVQRPDGIRRIVLPHPDPILDSSGTIVGAVNMLVDITDTREKEKALKESEKRYKKIESELEKCIEERKKSFKALNLPLRAIKNELDQFASAVSDDPGDHLKKIKSLVLQLKNAIQENNQD